MVPDPDSKSIEHNLIKHKGYIPSNAVAEAAVCAAETQGHYMDLRTTRVDRTVFHCLSQLAEKKSDRRYNAYVEAYAYFIEHNPHLFTVNGYFKTDFIVNQEVYRDLPPQIQQVLLNLFNSQQNSGQKSTTQSVLPLEVPLGNSDNPKKKKPSRSERDPSVLDDDDIRQTHRQKVLDFVFLDPLLSSVDGIEIEQAFNDLLSSLENYKNVDNVPPIEMDLDSLRQNFFDSSSNAGRFAIYTQLLNQLRVVFLPQLPSGKSSQQYITALQEGKYGTEISVLDFMYIDKERRSQVYKNLVVLQHFVRLMIAPPKQIGFREPSRRTLNSVSSAIQYLQRVGYDDAVLIMNQFSDAPWYPDFINEFQRIQQPGF